MPLRHTVLDDVVRSAWRRLGRLWRPMAVWTALVWLAAAAVAAPLSSALPGRDLLRGARLVGNEDLLAWALTPRGVLYLLLAGGIGITAAVVRYAGIFHIVTDHLEGRRITVGRTALHLAPQLHLLFKLCVAAAAAAAVLAAPWLAGLAAIRASLLGAHDINYYLAVRPPAWRYAVVLAVAWTAAWAPVALHFAARMVLALPAYLDLHRPLRAALRKGWQRSAGGTGRMLRLLAVAAGSWLLVRFATQALVLAGGAAATEWVAAATSSLRVVVLAAAFFVSLSFGLDAVVSFAGFSFLATLLTKIYYEGTDLHAAAPPAPSLRALPRRAARRVLPWLHPSRVFPALSLLVAASVLVSALLLERAPLPRQVVISAHRAGPAPSPENTLAALERAIAAGADFAEIDVQRTADGVVVVAHDADLMRMAGDPRRIAATPYEAFGSVVMRPDDGSPAEERRLATLAEFLARARGRIGLQIELKYYGADPLLVPAVVREVRAHGAERDVAVMSLSVDAVRQVRRIAPDLRTGYIAAAALGDIAREPVDFLAVARPLATPRLIRAAGARGTEVHVWTVNRAPEMAELIERGVHGLITDDPALAARVQAELAGLAPAARLLLRFRSLRETGGRRHGGEGPAPGWQQGGG
jgi:glycerophosphoryl diester phosphodiesterase